MKKFGLLILLNFSCSIFASGIEDQYEEAMQEQGVEHIQTNKIPKALAMIIAATPEYKTTQKEVIQKDNRAIKFFMPKFNQIFENNQELYKKAVTEKIIADVIVHKHPNSQIGYGLFANSNISQGAFLGEYLGEITTLPKNDPTTFVWSLGVLSPGHLNNNINKMCGWLDAQETCKDLCVNASKYGNQLRYVNHNNDQDANCIACSILNENDILLHLCYIATKDIPTGEEVTIDYGPNYILPNGKKPVKLGLYNVLNSNNPSHAASSSNKTCLKKPVSGFKAGFLIQKPKTEKSTEILNNPKTEQITPNNTPSPKKTTTKDSTFGSGFAKGFLNKK